MAFQASQSTQDGFIDSQTDSQSSQSFIKLVWTSEMETTLVEELVEQTRLGKRSDQGWKREAWEAVRTKIQSVYTGPIHITIDQVKNKENIYYARYKEFVFLENNSGFGYKDDRFTAPNNI